MAEFVIDNGVVIDDIDGVINGIARLSGMDVPDPLTIKKFVTNEESTKFYIDNKCSCKMQPDRDTVYLWLDSGFMNFYGDPIMISLLNNGNGYTGHYCGTMKELAGSVASHYHKNKKNIHKNIGMLRIKYDNKISKRKHSHIFDEQEYLIKSSNAESGSSIMEDIIKGLNIAYDEPVCQEEIAPEVENNGLDTPEEPHMSAMENEITIGLLYEQIEHWKDYAGKLLGIIEKFNTVDKVKMKELEAENAEYKRALVEIRNHRAENNSGKKVENSKDGTGHSLLGQRGKILVLGECALDEKIMNGIAKTYGFERKDFVYETSYEKIKEFAGRISYGSRFSAIILGACPHKVNQLGDYSSIIEKCKNDVTLPNAYDARTLSGELKVTKESYRRALESVIEDLMDRQAV